MFLSYKKLIILFMVTILIFFTVPCFKNTNKTTLNINNKNSIFNLLKNNYLYIQDNYFNDIGILYYFNDNKLSTIDYYGSMKIYTIDFLESTYDKAVYNLSYSINNCKSNENTKLIIHRSKGNKICLVYQNLLKSSYDLDILSKSQFINHIVNNNFLYENISIKDINLNEYDINKALK